MLPLVARKIHYALFTHLFGVNHFVRFGNDVVKVFLARVVHGKQFFAGGCVNLVTHKKQFQCGIRVAYAPCGVDFWHNAHGNVR